MGKNSNLQVKKLVFIDSFNFGYCLRSFGSNYELAITCESWFYGHFYLAFGNKWCGWNLSGATNRKQGIQKWTVELIFVHPACDWRQLTWPCRSDTCCVLWFLINCWKYVPSMLNYRMIFVWEPSVYRVLKVFSMRSFSEVSEWFELTKKFMVGLFLCVFV